jgi:hypothetical protein
MQLGEDIRRLCPEGTDVWEIKSHLGQPQLRVFGWFVLPKWFIAVQGFVRDDLEKGRGPKWDRAIEAAAQARGTLVGSVKWNDEDPRKYL